MRMRRSMDNYRTTHLYCEWPGCHRIMHTVDHVTPLAEGGDRYDWNNYQSLCAEHHQLKTTKDALRGKRRIR